MIGQFLRMSLFSNRQILTHEIPQIPFVFAGDEFQTLNPTGFKWDSVKAMFTEKFILAVNPTANNLPISNKLTINYQTLLNNYRSSSHIVGFCNFIQALRIARFKLTGVKPQKEWSNRNEQSPVVSYLSNSELFWDGIKKRAADTVFIIPASEENILEYIKNDPYLNEHIRLLLNQSSFFSYRFKKKRSIYSCFNASYGKRAGISLRSRIRFWRSMR